MQAYREMCGMSQSPVHCRDVDLRISVQHVAQMVVCSKSRTALGLHLLIPGAFAQAYVDMFSKSLGLEYKQYGISVHNQAPAYVATKMSKIRKPSADAPSPKDWVAAAVKHIGYEPTQCPFPWVSHPQC